MFRQISSRVLMLVLFLSYLNAYDTVKVNKVIPIADRTIVPTLLKMDFENQWWTINDKDQSVLRMTPSGTVSFRFPTGKKGFFKNPIDFGFFKNGSLAVLDAGKRKVIIVTPHFSEKKGEKISEWGKAQITTQFSVENGASIAISHDDIIAVGYNNQNAVDLFSMDGVFLHRDIIPEKYSAKSLSSLSFSPNGQLWALEADAGHLHRFAADRKWLGVTESLDSPQCISMDPFGYAYVSLTKGKWLEISPSGEILGSFGTKGKNPGELLNPRGIQALDGSHVVVVEMGNKRLQIFETTDKNKLVPLPPEPAAYLQVRLQSQWEDKIDGALLGKSDEVLLYKVGQPIEFVDLEGATKSTWKKTAKGEKGLRKPTYFTRDHNQTIWVVDAGDHSIKSVTEDGMISSSVGQKGSKEGYLKNPNLVAVRKDGSFVIVDKDFSRVQVLSPKGLFLFSVGSEGKKEGQYLNVAGLAVNENLIAILDNKRKALLFFNSSGKFQSEISNQEGRTPFWNNPVSLTSDGDGHFYLLDRDSRRVRIFNRLGQFMGDFSAEGEFITAGPHHRILVASLKAISIFNVHFVAHSVQSLVASDDSGDIKVSWDPLVETDQFNLYRRSPEGLFELYMKDVVSPATDTKVKPGAKYTYAVTGVNSLGYEGSFTFTEEIKASKRKDVSLISIEKSDFKPVFTAAFKYYVTTPIGTIDIRNNDEMAHRKVKLSLALSRYSDYPTEVLIDDLQPGEVRSIPVTMTFNDRVLELSEDTPVQTEITVSYFEENQAKKVTLNAPITLFSRNAISWADKSRIASFITSRDVPIVEFSRETIRDYIGALKTTTVGKSLAKVALFFEALNALNITYVPDPKTPFQDISGKPEAIDYVQFPRETLRRKTGDCDDMTSLMASLLTSVGVQVVLVDVPGHIFLMANTEESDPSKIGLPIERFVEYEGTYWVPVEMTQLGKDFMAAWQSGIVKIKAGREKKALDFISVQKAQKNFPPVTLVEADPQRPVFPSKDVKEKFLGLLTKLETERYNHQLKTIKAAMKEDPKNQMLEIELGMVHVEGKKSGEAKTIFSKIATSAISDDVKAAALNNLGNLSYLSQDYINAEKQYGDAAKLAPKDGNIIVNQGRAAWKAGDTKSAKNYFSLAQQMSPEWLEYATDVPAELLPN